MTRAEKIAKARELREQGMAYDEIACEVGVASTTVYRWLNPDYAQRHLAAARRWKQTHKEPCPNCGEPMDVSNGRGTTDRCAECYRQELRAARRWTHESIIAAIRLFAGRNGRQPTSREWQFADRPCEYPPVSTVQREFGTWSAAVEAAGLPRPRPGHYVRNPRPSDRAAA